MASIQRRQRGEPGTPTRYRVRWRAEDGRERSKTFDRADDARRFKARLEGDLVAGTCIDPALAKVSVGEWTRQWRSTVMGLRPTSLGRLDATLANQVLPRWGHLPLSAVTNADVRAWAAGMRASGLSPSTVRKAVFTLRQILAAAVADRRIPFNPADNVPLPVEERGEQRFLTADEVAVLADVIAPRFRAMVLVAAYGGLRFGELTALRRERVDLLRGRVAVLESLAQVGGDLYFGPTKTRNGRRMVPLPRMVLRELDAHLGRWVLPDVDALVFTGLRHQPLRRDARLADEMLNQRVMEARSFNRSWSQIAAAVGITKQSANRRWRALDAAAEALAEQREREYKAHRVATPAAPPPRPVLPGLEPQAASWWAPPDGGALPLAVPVVEASADDGYDGWDPGRGCDDDP